MNVDTASYILRSGIIQVLMLSAPVLIIGMSIGLIVSIFQATTSIQDQTLTFVPKIAAILGALVYFGDWMFTQLREFTMALFERIPDMVL